jgi:Lrp/AsnC family transcriptional regulator, leucine-responsive regulatory protein
MRVTEKDGEILYCAQLQANAPVSKIRKLTGYRDHTIRYAINSAVERGLLRPACFVNLFLLGLTQYEIYFSLSSEKKFSRERLLQALIDCEKVSWVGDLGGEYHYGLNICVRSVKEVADFLEGLSSSLGLIYLEKAFAARLALSFFGNKYLSNKKKSAGELCYKSTYERVDIDETDHRILSALVRTQHDSRRDLAHKLGLPFSTLENRVKKLEKQGVIVGYYYQMDASLLGIQSFMLLLNVKGFNAERKKKFYRFCQVHPNIVILIEAVGSWDFEIVAEVREARQVIQLVQELQDNFAAYLHAVKVLPSFDYPKVREYPFEQFKTFSAG